MKRIYKSIRSGNFYAETEDSSLVWRYNKAKKWAKVYKAGINTSVFRESRIVNKLPAHIPYPPDWIVSIKQRIVRAF